MTKSNNEQKKFYLFDIFIRKNKRKNIIQIQWQTY